MPFYSLRNVQKFYLEFVNEAVHSKAVVLVREEFQVVRELIC